MSEPPSCYLGDGLYASYDGYQIRLWTDRGDQGGIHEVFLEPMTLQNFLGMIKVLTNRKPDER